MNRRIKRKIKKAFNKNRTFFLVLTFLFAILFMVTAYALLSTDINLGGKTIISKTSTDEDDAYFDKIASLCKSSVSYVITQVGESETDGQKIYTYYGTINIANQNENPNYDEATIYTWQLKLRDSKDIISVDSPHAKITEENDSYILNALEWNATVWPGTTTGVQVTIKTTRADGEEIFKKTALLACGRAEEGGEERVITSGNASLTLGQLEEELTGSIVTEKVGNDDWDSSIYKITITNTTEYTILGWRGVINHLGIAVQDVYPCNASYDAENYNIKVSNWSNDDGLLKPGDTYTFTLALKTSDPDYKPDFVFAGLKNLSARTVSE